MFQLKTVLAHQDSRQLRIMGHMVMIQTHKEFRINAVASCRTSAELYQAIFKHHPTLVIVDESMFTPCLNCILDKTQVVLITADKTKRDTENIHYLHLPVQPATIAQKVLQITKTAQMSDTEVSSFLNVLRLPEDYCDAIDCFVESRHWLLKFGIGFSEQREKVFAAIQSGELDVRMKMQDVADKTFDMDAIYNPAAQTILKDFEPEEDLFPEPAEDSNRFVKVPLSIDELPPQEPYEEPPVFETGEKNGPVQSLFDNEVSVDYEEMLAEPEPEPEPEMSEHLETDESGDIPIAQNVFDSRYHVSVKEVAAESSGESEKQTEGLEDDDSNETPLPMTAYPPDVSAPVDAESYTATVMPEDSRSAILNTREDSPSTSPMSTESEVDMDTSCLNDMEHIVGIDWEKMPAKQTYAIGENPIITDGVILAVYADGRKERHPVTQDMLSGIRFTKPGNQVGKVRAFGFELDFPVTYLSIKLKDLIVSRLPDKYEYIEGEHLDLTGIIVEKVYSNGYKERCTDYSYPDVPLTMEMKTVPLSYNKRKCYVFIHVNPREEHTDKSASTVSDTKESSLIGIRVIGVQKICYTAGEPFDPTGGTVICMYDDGSETTVALESDMVSGYFPEHTGKQLLTVSYLGQRCTLEIFVKESQFNRKSIPDESMAIVYPEQENSENSEKSEKMLEETMEVSDKPVGRVLENISFAEQNRKSVYANGERIRRGNFRLMLHYSDGSFEFANNFEMTPSDVATADITEIIIRYKDFYLTHPITVTDKELVVLMLDSAPDKSEYILGDTVLDMTGAKATLFYTDQSFETVDIPVDWVSGFNCSKAGKQVLTVQVQGKIANFTINVVDREVSSIAITKMPRKIKYIAGETFDPSGMEVSVKYNDGYFSERAPFIYDKTPLKAGDTTVAVFVGDKETSVFIEVEERSVVRIAMEALPYKTAYLEGEREFDPAGGLVAKYNSAGEKDIIPLGTAQYSGFNSVKAGICRILVTIEQCTCEFEVSIMQKELTGLSVYSAPLKSVYAKGDTFDPTGLVLHAEYNDGTFAHVTNYVVSTAVLDTNTQFVKVSFETMTVNVPVSVVGRQIENVSLSKMPHKLMYQEHNESLDMTGAELFVLYADGTTEFVPVTNDMVSGFNNTIAGENVVYIKYEGYEAPLRLQICAANLIGIAIQRPPYKTEYHAGDFFDEKGMEVVAYYDNGTQSLLHNYSITPNSPLTVDDAAVVIAYMDKSITLPVTVHMLHDTSFSNISSGNFYPDAEDLRFEDDDDLF